MNRCRLRIPVLTDRSLQTTPVSHDSQNPTNGLTMTAYRRKLWLRPPNGCRLRSGTASFMKLLLSVGVILWAVHASAQEVRPGREKLPDALPPTSVVAASPSPSSMSSNRPEAVDYVALGGWTLALALCGALLRISKVPRKPWQRRCNPILYLRCQLNQHRVDKMPFRDIHRSGLAVCWRWVVERSLPALKIELLAPCLR